MNFVSQSEVNRKREEKRIAQEYILAKAKKQYEQHEKKIAEAGAKGQNTWILPDLSKKIDEQSKELKKKQKKLKKKKKKSKSSKHHKRSQSSGSSSESEKSDNEQWVEKTKNAITPSTSNSRATENQAARPALQRDEWMTMDSSMIPTVSRQELREKIQQEKAHHSQNKLPSEEAGQHEKELNPYWKSGDRSGLPEESKVSEKPKLSLSYLKSAYSRCEHLAAESGKTLDEVATERFGSLEELETMIMDAERKEELDKMEKERSTDDRRSRQRRSHSKERSKPGADNRKSFQYQHRDEGRGRRDRSRSRSKSRDYRRDRVSEKDKRFQRPRSHSHSRGRQRQDEDVPYKQSRFVKPVDESEIHQSKVKSSAEESHRPAWKKPGAAGNPILTPSLDKVSSTCTSNREKGSAHLKYPSSQPESSSETESSSEDSDAPPSPVEVALTEDEMNALGAKILKAELMGDEELANSLKEKLDKARSAKKTGLRNPPKNDGREQTVVLAKTDQYGNVRPLDSSDSKATDNKHSRKRAKKVETHDKSGQRERYFPDDDRFSIRDMVQAERMTTSQDQNLMFSNMAAKITDKTGEDYDIDDAMINRARLQMDEGKSAQKLKDQAQRDSRKMAETLDNCSYCFDNMTKHLIISVAKKTYLCLPSHQSLTAGHCQIVPIHHCMSATACDEDIWSEVQEFRRNLVKMFSANGEDCVFMECCKNIRKNPHMVIDCVPMDRELGDMAPIYFKKAIQESDTEWSQNKKLIDLSKKDVRHSVPKGFPFFSVDFGFQNGFAHIIEDENKFPSYFGKEVVGGMIDTDPHLWRNPKKENFEDQRRKVMDFAKQWKPYDFTISC